MYVFFGSNISLILFTKRFNFCQFKNHIITVFFWILYLFINLICHNIILWALSLMKDVDGAYQKFNV